MNKEYVPTKFNFDKRCALARFLFHDIAHAAGADGEARDLRGAQQLKGRIHPEVARRS
jgi:hypothetical protein